VTAGACPKCFKTYVAIYWNLQDMTIKSNEGCETVEGAFKTSL
jgi:hypothetical protein